VGILENLVETIGMSHHGLLGPQGLSFSFDSRAEGYARGEGVGTVIAKLLSAAIRDGDTIRAVIRETGVNQDGRTPGITVPSADAQEKLIREVYWRAGLDLEHTRFVEAHGTGTSTGDPIEAGALARAFKCRRESPLYVGAIKSSVGHLEGASGVASIIKSILTLETGIIPANFDMKQTNPSIPAAEWDIEFLPRPFHGHREGYEEFQSTHLELVAQMLTAFLMTLTTISMTAVLQVPTIPRLLFPRLRKSRADSWPCPD
jgi:Polyketide synthase modules and related proteins